MIKICSFFLNKIKDHSSLLFNDILSDMLRQHSNTKTVVVLAHNGQFLFMRLCWVNSQVSMLARFLVQFSKENPQHFSYYYIWNRIPRLYLWINCKSSRGPSFSIVNCTCATLYNRDATITFFLVAQQWTTIDATIINISLRLNTCKTN